MTRTVLLFRHAKAGRPAGVADRERPLTQEGQEQAAAVGRALAGRAGDDWAAPAIVLVSPSRRTRETFERAAEAGLRHGSVSVEPSIYEAEPDTLLALLQALPDGAGSALLVGHNPGIALLAGRLLGQEPPASLEMKPADLLVLQHRSPTWSGLGQGRCTLAWRFRPERPAD